MNEPTNWTARCNLAQSILSWRAPCGLTALLAMKALQGYPIEDLRSIERGYRETQGEVA